MDSQENKSASSEDPLIQLAMVNKYTKVQLIKNIAYTGFIHSIDPLTKSVILLIPNKNEYQTVLLPGHAVLKIAEETQPDDIKQPERIQIVSTEDTHARKTRLLAWFKFNRLPVSESGDNIVFGNVSILPPYSESDLCTDNPIVAMQVKKIIENMPIDFHS